MKHPAYRRGQPVMTLAVVLTAWVIMRTAPWQSAWESGAALPELIAAPARVSPLPVGASPGDVASLRRAGIPISRETQRQPRVGTASRGGRRGHVPTGDQTLWSAEARPETMNAPAGTPPVPYISPDAPPWARRWSADAWLMLRDGGGFSPVTGPTRATYGASQLGAVLRYRLAPESGHRPTAYVRGTAALVRPHDREVAAGLSARPVPSVPLTVAAELRGGEINRTTRVRPAVMAVTELPPQNLPLKLRGEAYAQAGYVGGTGSTAFVDGQLRIDTAMARIGRAELRFGGGVWGGAQKDASRFDLGPALNLGVSVNDAVFARVMLDWRFRVAGNAVPESGPALTLSAGF